jgi:hypothetical protein
MGFRHFPERLILSLPARNDRHGTVVSDFSPQFFAVKPFVGSHIHLFWDLGYNRLNGFVVAFSAVANFKILNLPFVVTQGSNFAGLEFPGFRDQPAPFLPTGWLSQYAPLLALGPHSGSFGTAGKRLSSFSRLYNGHEQLILVGILQAAIPTGSPFSARTTPLQNILCPDSWVCPYTVQARTAAQIPTAHHSSESRPLKTSTPEDSNPSILSQNLPDKL